MAKKRAPFNFGAADLFGGQSLDNDPLYKKAAETEKILGSVNPLGEGTGLKDRVTSLQYDADEYTRYLDGNYSGSAQDLDYRLGDAQSAGKQIINGLGRLLPLTATKLIGQAYGLAQAAEYGKKYLNGEDTGSVFADEEFSNSIQQWENSIKEAMPIYATEKYNEGTLLEQMGTSKFWSDDVMDGVAFLAAQVIGTKGIGAGLNTIGKGVSYLAKGLNNLELLAKVPGAAKIASAVANNYTSVTAGLMNAGFSGALQAQDTARQIQEGLQGKTNPNTGGLYTEEEIKQIAGEKASHTFNATFLTHILPEIWESKIFLGLNKAKLGNLRESIIGAVNRGEVTMTELLAGTGKGAELLKSVGRETLKGAAKGAFIEGLWEENIEQSIQNYDVQEGLSGGNSGIGERGLNYAMGLINNLGVKNDAKAVVLGMILGGPMGGVEGYSHNKDFNEKMPAYLNTLRSAQSLYQADVNSIYKTHAADVKDSEGNIVSQKGSMILDEQGNPTHDPEKLKNLTFQVLNQKKLWDRQAVATLTGNTDMVTLNENMALSSAVFRELATAVEDGDTEGALDFLKWRIKKQLEEQSNEEANKSATDISTSAVSDVATAEDPQGNIEAEKAATKAKSASAGFNGRDRADLSRTINADLSKLDTFSKAYKDSQQQAKRLIRVGQDESRTAFTEVVQKGLYYEAIKRASLDTMVEERKNALQDPMADIDAITQEINSLTAIRDDSVQKSKAYLTNTDEVYAAYAGPRVRYGQLLGEAQVTEATVQSEQNAEERTKAERKRDTILYQLNEMEEVEGLGTDNGAPIFNEENITNTLAERVRKPIGTRNEFFWNAGNDYSKIAELNEKIELYKQGKLELIDVINYAKENISNLDSETVKKLNSLLSTERGKLAALEQTIASTEEILWEEVDGELEANGTNPEYLKLNAQRQELAANIEEMEKVLTEKKEASEVELINNQPQNIFKHLIKKYAMKHFDKGKYVLRNALDINGEVREDYFDRDTVNRAIKDLSLMRNALQDRLDDGDLKDVKGLSYLISDADKMLTKLYEIREKTELNRNNREGKQASINRAEATSLISATGYDLATGAITSQAVFNSLDSVLDGTLGRALKDISEMDSNHYEAAIALLHKVQTKATEGQMGQIDSQLKTIRLGAQATVAALLDTKGVNNLIIKGFVHNPRQVFTSAWTNISHNNGANGYVRQTNSKGTLFNTFLKNNDIDELIAKADNLPDTTMELGMPKADFMSLVTAFKSAVSAEKLQRMLVTSLKPLVQAELKEAAEAELTPTVQQNISIREGIAWLNRTDKSSSPFRGWAFLRGIAGTGKTNVVLKWILNTSRIDKSEILTTALTGTATKVAANATGTAATLFDDLEQNGIPANIKLLVIDEYGTIGVTRLEALEQKVREARRNGQDIKVLMLGDPTQITPRLSSNDDINNISKNLDAGNIEIINPVTVVYRSDVSAVNEASDLFQDNNREVGSITVRADKPIGSALVKGVHVSADASQIATSIARNIKEEEETGLTPRTRAIIVGRQEDIAKYEGLGADVMTVFDAQSKTYDEIYVDIAKTTFPDPSTYNTAMYTAASRAKLYSFLTYPEGENITDSSIATEYTNNTDRLKEAKTAFIQAKTQELAMMEGLDKGQPLKQATKEAKKESQDAGKSTLDLEVEESQIEDFTDTTAEVPSMADNSDTPVDPELSGDIDPETELPAAPSQEAFTVQGTRQTVDNVDAEAYPALRDGRIGAKLGNKVLYLYNKESNGENAVSVISQDSNGKWVRIGKIFQEQILNDPRYSDIKTKVAGLTPFPTDETDVLNGRRTAGKIFTPEQLAKYAVREGKIGTSQYLRFLYHKGLQDSKNLASDLASVFREKFYYRSQSVKADQVHFKIFTISEIENKDYDGSFKPEPGIPYAIIGSDSVSYKNAMFVRLQPTRITKNDDQIQTLKRLAESVDKVHKLTGIEMGTTAFWDLMRVFRNSIEIVQEQTTEGTVPRMQARSDYSRQEMIANAESMYEKDKRDGDPNLLKTVPDDRLQDAIVAIQDVAMQVYGIKNKEGKYTKAEIEAMGEEFESVPTKNKETRKGEEVFYAQLKGSTKRDYKREPRLDKDNGVAQIAFNQIARANEFIGDRRIRVQQHLGRATRKKSYTGKSLINAEGGNSRVWEMINLVANSIVGPKMEEKGEISLNTKEGLEAARKKVREGMYASGQDEFMYLQSQVFASKDPSLANLFTEIMKKKETYPVTLSTLQILTDDKNFDGKGGHMTADQFHVRNSEGTLDRKQTFIRKPLHIDKFNELGANPFENAEELSKLVTTSFDGIAPTKIDVDFGDVEVQPTDEDLQNTLPVDEVTTEHHADIDSQIEVLKAKAATETDKKTKVRLTLQLNKLIKSKGRMPYDSNASRPAPGQRISIKEAMAELKRFIPSTTASEIEFASKAVMSQLAKPGENLLGLFDKGKIFLQSNDNGVYDKVLRHEVMHKIYNEFLTNKERRQLRAELDPAGRLTTQQFDEFVSDLFMNWQKSGQHQSLGEKITAVFKKILEWFGFYHGNRSVMETIFNNIEAGKYSHKIGGTSDVRRAFSDIKTDFGSTANYKQAVNAIHGMVRDSVMLNNLDSTPITMKEAKEYVKQQLSKQKNDLVESLAGLKEIGETLTEEDGETFTEVQNEITDTVAQLSTLNAMLKSDKVFNQLWRDMYPNYNFRAGEAINSFEDNIDEYTEHDDLDEVQLEADDNASKLLDFTLSPDERNQEGKVTENVKNFLSFIFRPTGTRVNPRYAYLECLRTLHGLVSGDGNLKEQIREAATANGIDMTGKSDGKLVIDHILNLIDSATSTDWLDENGNDVSLTRNARFFSEDKFYIVPEGGDISLRSEVEVSVGANGSLYYTRQYGESTPAFITRIVRESGLEKRQVIGYFKQSQAQETMREVMSNFLSQRESDPMIAEEVKEGSMGNTSTILRYFHAQMHGSERVAATDIETAIKNKWREIPLEVWDKFDQSKDDKEKIKVILHSLGIKRDLNLTDISGVAQNLDAFRNVVNEAYADGKPKPIQKTGEDTVEGEQEFIQYRDVEYLLADEKSLVNSLTRIVTRNSADARPSKYQSTDGKSRYSFHNSNQAVEIMERVIHATGTFARKALGLPAHLQTEWAKLNPFVEGKLNRIHKLLDHDGMRRQWGEEFAKGYTDESNADNWARQFSYGFLAYTKGNTSKSDLNLKYVQFFYTISNRPRMIGAEVNVLRPSELREAAHRMLKQHLEQPEHSSVANYDKYKTINMEEMGKAIDKVLGKRDSTTYANVSNAQAEVIVTEFENNLKAIAKQVSEQMVAEKMLLGDNAGQVLNLMKDSRRKYADSKTEGLSGMIRQTKDEVGYTAEQISPLVESWVMNNYINGYFMNQLPVGNFNYFKSALDLVKRMSGVFAPGTKGLVGDEFFMKTKFKMAIMNDPKMYSDELSEVFKDNDTALYNEAKNDLSRPNLKGERKEKGFDLADAQGFMLPSRAENIVAGMGKAYNAGTIFKPAHYEIAERGEAGYVPVMIKYSSAVLSDELCEKFPKLKKLRDAMIANEVDELVFDSANKVGGPTGNRSVPKYNDTGASEFSIPTNAVVTLSNENYRLQLNPKHDTFSSVSNPTQLGYFLNVMGKLNPAAGKVNDEAATEVYTAIGNLIQHGLKKVNAGLTATGKVSKAQLAKTLTGAGNERIAEMLKELSYNMPNIADKALIQIMNMFAKETVKIKFKGGKFVLQSAYGFEMVKRDSDRYNQMSGAEQKAHDANWSRYGEEERAKLGVQARGLKYGTDEKGRMYAEVLIDKSYAEKAKVGDFLLPDMMGYRIPSTELHSSVAVKVAGFYDSRGSNVIVAPPELVKQHGSDFDVDSLYVIGREVFDKDIPEIDFLGDTPVGYEWNSGLNKWIFNKHNWEKKFPIWYQKAGTNTKVTKQIDKLYEMFQRNIIVENFLNVISHPLNISRMTEPISTEVISEALKELNLEFDRQIDLSNPIDNQEVYNSNFQGAKLVGIFANGMKSLAYMLKAGTKKGKDVEYPQLQKEDSAVILGEDIYGEFKEALPDGKNIWQVMDALVNTAVDNVKDQKLFKINATNATGNMYVASQALGIPLKDVITFMLQPIGLMHSKLGGKIEPLKAELLAEYNKKSSSPIEKYTDLAALSSSIKLPAISTMRQYMNKSLAELDEKEVLKQVAMMRSFENLYNLGQDITTFSSAVGIVQDFPVMYKDIAAKQEKWDKMGSVEGDIFTTSPDFSFNLDNLFSAQPNIREAYKAFTRAKETAEISLTKHLPAVRAFIDEVIKESGVKLSFKQNAEDLKNELISYLISTAYSDLNRQEAPYTYTYKGVERVATGRHAWSQRFAESVEQMKKKADGSNAFLNRIGVQLKYGMKSITFATSSNSDYMDNLEMQEGFEQLESEEVKRDFVRYAVMNYGLKFGVKNYSMFIPVEYLKDIDSHLQNIDGKLRRNKIEDGAVIEGELKNLKDNFLLRLAVNNAEKLPFISSKDRGNLPGLTPIPTEGKTVIVQDITGPKEVPSLTGFDEYFYHRKYANPLNGENRNHKAERFPLFIRTGDNIAMIRLNDPDNDFIYYQRLGMKNWMGGYDADPSALNGEYTLTTYFDKGLIPLPVSDIQANNFQVNNDYVKVGSKVIVYGYSNESRDQGRFGIVESVSEDLVNKAKKTLTIKDIDARKLTIAQEEFLRRYNPVMQRLASRFNLTIKSLTDAEMQEMTGQIDIKGTIKDGEIYINMDKAKGDTAFHEVAHPLVKVIRERNPAWFQSLMEEVNSSERASELKEAIDHRYGELNLEGKQEELLVTLLGELAEGKLDKTPSLKKMAQRLWREIGNIIKDILRKAGVINLEHISSSEMASVTLNDLAELLAAKNANISLDLSGFVKEDKMSQELDNIEQRLFKEGRIELSCKV